MNIRLFPLNIKEYGIASLEIDLGNNIEPYIWLYKSWTNDNYESEVKPSLFQFIFNWTDGNSPAIGVLTLAAG